MITIFNRKELIITNDMRRQADIRYILEGNGIDYIVRTTNMQTAPMMGGSRGRTGSFQINQNYSYEYKIYVRKKDYERAKHLIRSQRIYVGYVEQPPGYLYYVKGSGPGGYYIKALNSKLEF